MAEEQDPSSKTEEPTGKRLEESFKRGDVARSVEINHWFMFIGIALAIVLFGGGLSRSLIGDLAGFLAAPHAMPVDAGALIAMFRRVAGAIGFLFAPVLVLLAIFAIGSNLVQNRPGFATEKLKPDWNRVSLGAGLKRYFSMTAVVEFAKSLLKICVVGAVGAYLIWPKLASLPALVSTDIAAVPGKLVDLTLLLLASVIAVMSVIAGADLVYQKLRHLQQLRMTRQEVREEHKQTEGDPTVKARLRAIRLDRARKRMMAQVPKADVVITNPTHYAVALKYDRDSMNAPRVVAKGADLVAARIRESATEHKVPIVENPPLARALFTVELDREIPPEHYRAVAEIIGYVMRLKGRMSGPAPRPTA